jgi:hypothetical protein
MTDDPGQRFVDWVADLLQRAPLAQGLDRPRLEALAWSLATETQVVLHLAQAQDAAQREKLAHMRHVMQFQARAMLANLGVLAMPSVERIPRDADGWDIQVGELFALDRAALLERCAAMEREEQGAD